MPGLGERRNALRYSALRLLRWTLCIDFGALWQSTKDIFNSGFFIAIVGSLAGAFAGTYGAQRIIAKGKEREELLAEIRNTNAATVVALAICNSFLSIKKQHVKCLKRSFDAQKTDYLNRVREFNLGQLRIADPPSTLSFNLQVLILPKFPLVILRNQIFEKLSLDNRRPLMLVNSLDETVQAVNTSVTNRNRLIDAWRAAYLSPDDILPLYFGLPQEGTHTINLEYPALIDAIYQQTDDGIFYSKMLCDDLYDHNVRLINRFKQRFRADAPGAIDKPDFSTPQNEGLMPSDANYQDWITLFRRAGSSAPHRKAMSSAWLAAWHRVNRRIGRIVPNYFR